MIPYGLSISEGKSCIKISWVCFVMLLSVLNQCVNVRSCSYGLPIQPHTDSQIKHTTGGVVIDLHADSVNTAPDPSCFDMDGADPDSVQSVNQLNHPAAPECAQGLTHRNLYSYLVESVYLHFQTRKGFNVTEQACSDLPHELLYECNLVSKSELWEFETGTKCVIYC